MQWKSPKTRCVSLDDLQPSLAGDKVFALAMEMVRRNHTLESVIRDGSCYVRGLGA